MRRLLIGSLICLAGCGQANNLPKDVLVKVNHYSITTEEFNHALDASKSVFKSYPDLSPREIKEKVLDEMIVNQLILEEAQKLGLDKQEAFMREVELYWRQALLKGVIQAKNKEFFDAEPVTDTKLRALYAREGQQLELQSMYFADELKARGMSRAGFDAAFKNPGAGVVRRKDTGWWMSGDFPDAVEEAVWGLDIGDVSYPFYIPGDGWVVMKVVSKEHVDQKPFEETAGALRKRLAGKSAQVKMDLWVGALRSRAKIFKDQSKIDHLEFGKEQGGQSDK
ncbi:MAG: peptidylprolyl isomerase [Candidatus Omnitrophota bacterium]